MLFNKSGFFFFLLAYTDCCIPFSLELLDNTEKILQVFINSLF